MKLEGWKNWRHSLRQSIVGSGLNFLAVAVVASGFLWRAEALTPQQYCEKLHARTVAMGGTKSFEVLNYEGSQNLGTPGSGAGYYISRTRQAKLCKDGEFIWAFMSSTCHGTVPGICGWDCSGKGCGDCMTSSSPMGSCCYDGVCP